MTTDMHFADMKKIALIIGMPFTNVKTEQMQERRLHARHYQLHTGFRR